MKREDSIKVSAYIAGEIAGRAPYIDYTSDELDADASDYTAEELTALKRAGYLDDDYEKFFVIREFCNSLGISELDGGYLRRLFMLAKKLDADEFESDRYLSDIRFEDTRRGDFLLTRAYYRRGEILQYDMPEVTDDMVVPRLGFFTREVKFPALYEGVMPWVSVCPSEINSMLPYAAQAAGRVLVLGLGLGYYPYIISLRKSVTSITIVERSDEVIDIFNTAILPSFGEAQKIKIVKDDALEYIKHVAEDEFDFCFADIWEGAADGADCYLKIKPHEKRLSKTRFCYWIENEIKEHLSTYCQEGCV